MFNNGFNFSMAPEGKPESK